MTSGTISRNASPISAPARYGSVRIVLADLNRMISPFENNKDRSFFVLCVLAPRSLSVGDTIPRCLNLFSAIIPNTLVANEPSEQAWGSAQVAQQVPYERGHVGAPGGCRHTGIIPRDAHVLRIVVIRRKPDSSANASGRHILRPKVRSPLLVRHSEGSCHRSRRIPSAALREGGGGLPGNVEELGLRAHEISDPARQ